MSKKNRQNQPTPVEAEEPAAPVEAAPEAPPRPEQKRRREVIYYRSIQFKASFSMAMGQSYSTQMGSVECSTSKRPARYEAKRIPGDTVVMVSWKAHDGSITDYDVPLDEVMGMTRMQADEEPAPMVV